LASRRSPPRGAPVGWPAISSSSAGRYADRIFGFTEAVSLVYGGLAGERSRAGRPMPIADAMIAAVAKTHGAKLATRNLADFEGSGLELISPWAA